VGGLKIKSGTPSLGNTPSSGSSTLPLFYLSKLSCFMKEKKKEKERRKEEKEGKKREKLFI
jgi:hypothetical protein